MRTKSLINFAILGLVSIIGLTSCGENKNNILKDVSFEFDTSNNTASVKGLKNEEDNLTLEIPSTVYKDSVKYTVTSIGELAFSDSSNLIAITLPDTITTISSQAFARCTNLSKIKLSDTLELIDSYAFDSCTSLININLPDSLLTLSKGSFRKCTSLTGISLPNNINVINSEVFSGDTKLNYIYASHIEKIETSAFASCSKLKYVYLSSSSDCNDIAQGNTYYTNASKTFNLSLEQNENTSKYNFVYDFSNKSCYISGLIDFNKEYKKLDLPKSVTNFNTTFTVLGIYDYAFLNSNVEEVVLPDTITKLNSYCFSYSKINKIDLNKVVQIEQYAFSNCTNLSDLTLNDLISLIGVYAFFNCTSLLTVILPLSLKEINTSLFEGCIKLMNVTIKENVTSIKDGVFRNCSNLKTINYTLTKSDFAQISIDSTVVEEIKNVSFVYNYLIESAEA